jgi:hypothetical protein
MEKQVRNLSEFDVIDLEGDEYADPDREDPLFGFEYQTVIGVEQETVNCVRVDTDHDSYGFPPNHKIPVVAEVEE